MRILGIDPGAKGAVALLANGSLARVWDTPTTLQNGKARVDAGALASIVRDARADHAFLERVNAMPGQGVSSMFAFGRALGIAEGVVLGLGVPLTWLTPVEWKHGLRVPADKSGARARASQLFPSSSHHWPLVKHDGRAEAALIALYGARRDGLTAAQIEW